MYNLVGMEYEWTLFVWVLGRVAFYRSSEHLEETKCIQTKAIADSDIFFARFLSTTRQRPKIGVINAAIYHAGELH
jgi:hypothetical protein